MVCIVAIQHKVIWFRFGEFLLNGICAAIDNRSTGKNIHSVDIANESTILDSHFTAILHIHSVAIIFFCCKCTIAGNRQIAMLSHRNQRPCSRAFIPNVGSIVQLLAVHIENDLLSDRHYTGNLDILQQDDGLTLGRRVHRVHRFLQRSVLSITDFCDLCSAFPFRPRGGGEAQCHDQGQNGC